MKSTNIILALVLFINFSYSQELTKDYYDNGQLKAIGKGKNPNTPVTLNPNQPPPAEGEWKFYYENGKLRCIGSYEKGYRIGLWKNYYENGKMESEGRWTKTLLTAKRDGTWKFYHENGNLKSIGSYSFHDIHGHKKQGEWSYYNEDGKLFTIQNYDEDKVTWMKEYNVDTGKVQREYHDNNNLGYWKFYNESGTLNMEGNTNTENKKVGVWKNYYVNGNLARTVNYSNGLMDGEETVYHDNGQPFRKVLWEKDKLMNIISYNDKKGNPLDYGDFKDGNGTINYYDTEGKLTGIIKVVNGVMQEQ